MPSPRTILAVSGSRADAGLMAPVLEAVRDEPGLTLRLAVTGAHLVRRTWRDLTAAGLRIDHRVPMQRRGRTGRGADVQALARGIAGLGRVIAEEQPDFVLVLGDRIEALAAACAASVGGHRLAHIHGGDRAQGVADEAMRHAITKLAHLHLCATAQSRRRILRMGEAPRSVHRVGSPAIDGLRGVRPAADAPELIVLQHGVGADDSREAAAMAAVLDATRGHARVVLAPNDDPGSTGVRAALAAAGVAPVEHLPRARFLSLLAGARAIVGNSSAGLIEAAALRVPCVNVGPRQDGREKPASVIDAPASAAAIRRALGAAFKLDRAGLGHPYGNGRTGQRIAQLLAGIEPATLPLTKRNSY